MPKTILQIESKCQFLSAIGREDTCDFRMKCPAAEMKQERRIMILKIVIQLLWLELLELRPNKIMLLFLEMRVTRKIVTRAAATFKKVFDQLSGNILFSSLVSFAFFYSSSFVAVVCLSLFELKNLDSDTYSSFLRLSDKKFSAAWFLETRLLSFWSDYKFLWTSVRLPGSSSNACTFQASCCIKTWQGMTS